MFKVGLAFGVWGLDASSFTMLWEISDSGSMRPFYSIAQSQPSDGMKNRDFVRERMHWVVLQHTS